MALRLPWRHAPPAAVAGGAAPATPVAGAAPLSQVVGALLHHLTLAQAQADQATVQLGDVYRQHPWLTRFPVPALSMRTVELELRVALVAPASPARPPTDAASPEEPEMRVLFTSDQLETVPPEHVSSVRMTMHFQPRRLVDVEGDTMLLP
jgi:hypothetical protein